jgi:hypothetical protein
VGRPPRSRARPPATISGARARRMTPSRRWQPCRRIIVESGGGRCLALMGGDRALSSGESITCLLLPAPACWIPSPRMRRGLLQPLARPGLFLPAGMGPPGQGHSLLRSSCVQNSSLCPSRRLKWTSARQAPIRLWVKLGTGDSPIMETRGGRPLVRAQDKNRPY